MRILIVLVLLAFASTVHAQDQIFRASLAAAVVAHALDTATTVDCRARKVCTEANPWLARYERPIPFALGKTTVATLTLWATAAIYERCESRKCTWSAIGLNIGQTVAFSFIAAHNARVSQ